MASSRSRRKNSLGTYISDLEQRVSQVEIPAKRSEGLVAGSISGESLAEEITLQNTTIQSGDFIEGEAGWRITSAGDAEFSNVVVRGDINAQTGTIGQWHMSSPVVTRRGILWDAEDAVGTFIENIDSGDDDVDETSGVFIGLFCSQNLETAGLYLNDYGDNAFDRGYFSSEGIYFSSPSYVNLILNPNFETSSGSSLLSWSLVSSTGYTGPTATNLTTTTSNITFSYNSTWGSRITWTSAPASWSYYRANVNFSEFKTKTYEAKDLVLSFDLYPFYEPIAKTVTALATTNSTTITVTSTSHGFSAGDYVYFDFTAYDSDTEPTDFAFNWQEYIQTHEVLTVLTNSFTIANHWGAVASGAITLAGLSSATVRAYKTHDLIFDASEIQFVFGAGSAVPLANVIPTGDVADFNAGGKYINLGYSIDALVEEFLYQPVYPATVFFYIDGSLLDAAYLAQDPSGYASQNDFYLDVPAYLVKGNINGTVTSTKVTSATALGYIIDYVLLSSSAGAGLFIDGNSIGASWEGTEAASVSYSATKEWINVDLVTGFSYLQDLYYADLYNASSILLDSNPGISTTNLPVIRGGIDGLSVDTSTLYLTGGSYYANISATEYVNKFSSITSSVDNEVTGIELYAGSAKNLIADDTLTGYGQASLTLWVENDRTSNVIIKASEFVASTLSGAPLLKSDYTYGTGTNATAAYYVRWRDDTTVTTTTSGTYVETANQCRCRFIAPPSGIVNITIGGQIENDATATTGRLSFQLYDITGGTVQILDGSDRWSIGKEGTLWVQASYNRIAGGLTPYSTYEVRAVMRRGAGAGTVTVSRRAITVVPMT
jgi:hypothetical protein